MLSFDEKYAKYQRKYRDALEDVLKHERDVHFDMVDEKALEEWCQTVDIETPCFLNTELYVRTIDVLVTTPYKNMGRASSQPFWDMLEYAHGSLVELCYDRATKYADYWNMHRTDFKATLADTGKIVPYIVFEKC